MCPVFIGRVSERDALSRLIDRTRSGQGGVALVCGEAGIGKSRLVAEAKAYAEAQDFFLLQGNCFQMDSSYPYAPLLDLLRASAVPTADAPDPIVLEFARLLPELAPSLAGPLPAPLPDPEQEKRRLFAALTRFFKERASQRPVLLVIEDLHWCDDISLEFLQSLARSCAAQPLLLLMTYRSDEVQPSLQRCLAQLDRARLSQELHLVPLSRSDVDAMLGAMFGLPETEQANLLDLIYPLTEGNPFFVEEVLTSLVSRGELLSDNGVWQHKPHLDHRSERVPVPRSVQDTMYQRTQHLSAEAMRVVTFAAVAGRRFDFAVLHQVMHCDEDQLLLLIKELLAIQFVVEVSADQFAFRHALTQQAVFAGLLARERRSLHRMLAEAIEQLYATISPLDAHLADLAYHYYEAGVWEKALEYEQRAGERALALYAQHAAIDHFTHALSALHHLSGVPASPIYCLRGQAYETLGEFERALSDYEHALEAANAAHDRRGEWQGMMVLGFLWTGRDYEQAGGWFRRASDLAENLADPTLRARSLNRLGNWLVNIGRTQEGLEAHQEALHLFETQQNTQGMAETLDLLGVAHGFSGDPANAVKHFGRAIAHGQEALRIATAIEHQQWIVGSYSALGQLYLLMLEPALAISALDAGLAVAQTLGSAYWIRNLTSYLALAYVLRQEFPRAEEVLKAVMPREYQPSNLGERQVARTWGELALAQGEPTMALHIAEQLIVSAPGDVHQQPIPHLLALKGEALIALKRLEEAARVLEDAKLGAEQRQALSVLWRVHGALGQVYHLLKREEQVQRECSASREIIAKLAETIDQTYLREHFVQAALQTLPSEKPLLSRRAMVEKSGGLTEREIEVLRAVAQGLTDIQVAEQLVISHRTVHSHLNSIYSKLSITSRSAATRYAIEHDLA